MLNVILTTYWYCCPWGVLLHGLHIIPSCYYEQNVILTTYWYCCPWGVLLHASQFILFCSRGLIDIVVLEEFFYMHYILFHRGIMIQYLQKRKDGLNTQPSWLGCVCVCTFSKEVKLVPVVDAERNIDYLLILEFLSLRSPFTCSSQSLFHFAAAGGMESDYLSSANEAMVSLEWKRMVWDAIHCTCLRDEHTWWSTNVWIIGHEGFSCLASCLFWSSYTRNIFCHDFGTWCLSFC